VQSPQDYKGAESQDYKCAALAASGRMHGSPQDFKRVAGGQSKGTPPEVGTFQQKLKVKSSNIQQINEVHLVPPPPKVRHLTNNSLEKDAEIGDPVVKLRLRGGGRGNRGFK
jgi:hypothetical protein